MSESGDSTSKFDPLNLDFSEIDDEEYNIPAVEETPTLESILNNDQNSLMSEDELSDYLAAENQGFGTGGCGSDTASISSFGSLKDTPSKTGLFNFTESRHYDHILRHIILKAISSQLKSACERVNAGRPTVMAVSSMIAVGTSHGLVLVFDSAQTLRWCHEGNEEQGSVSALDFNHNCSRLLIGYARGLILMCDVADGKVLRTMNQVHTPATAVLHVKFTDNPNLAVCSDSGGSVFELSFKRTLGIRSVDSRCIFSGSRGEVCCIEPLRLKALTTHPLHGSILVAMATLSKVILVCIRPNTRLLLTHSVSASPANLPLLTWQFVVIQLNDSSHVIDPVLAFARDSTIHFYHINVLASGRIHCTVLEQLNLGYSLLACHWLNARILATVDTQERFHLIDIRSQEELETLDLSCVSLVYNSSHFKGLCTGGNVSKAMALAGERACYNTIKSFGNQVLFLGMRSFHVISTRSWLERLNNLLEQNRYAAALRLGIDFLEERGKGVLGLSGHRKQRKKLIWQKVHEMLTTYINAVLHDNNALMYQENLPVIIEHCIHLQCEDLLFQQVWNGVEHSTVPRNIFLQSIEGFIQDGKIRNVSPAIMQKLVEYLEMTHRWQAMEECIVNVNVSSLDIEQVLQQCRSHQLYDALISVWNQAMNDYTTPLQELLPQLQRMLSSDGDRSEEAIRLGNKCLVYISCCLSGRGYPNGDIEESKCATVRSRVFQFLCSQHTINADESEETYPYLRLFLDFNTKEFLNALSMAFQDSYLSVQLLQRLVDILISITLHENSSKSRQVGWLFSWLAKEIMRPNCSLRLDLNLFEQVLEILVSSNDEQCTPEEKEQILLQLISTGALKHIPEERILQLAQTAGYHQVCAEIYERQGNHEQVLKCHLLDDSRKPRVFDYLNVAPEKSKLQRAVSENIDTLLEVNGYKTGLFVGTHFVELTSRVVHTMTKQKQFEFLQGVMDAKAALSPPVITLYFQLLCEFEPNSAMKFIIANCDTLLTDIESCVETAQKHNLEMEEAILWEKAGSYKKSFNILFKRLQYAIRSGKDVESATEELISLILRGSSVLDPKDTWLPLLQCLVQVNSPKLMKRVLNSADLNLAAEFHLLLKHTTGSLGDYRSLIMGLFEKCVYEQEVLQIAERSHYLDLHNQLKQSLNGAKRGIPNPVICTVCNKKFQSQMLLFHCTHGYHMDCLKQPFQCVKCDSN
nr:PREDICTED: vacuolar protein sorting-associated protein 8 homolog [Bemisia tabaci]